MLKKFVTFIISCVLIFGIMAISAYAEDNDALNVDTTNIEATDVIDNHIEEDSTQSEQGGNAASKIVKTQINEGSVAIPASIELINIREIGGYYGNIKINSSVNGIIDIMVKNNPTVSPALSIKETDVDGYIIIEENNNIIIKAETVTEGEVLTVDIVNTSVVFDAIGECIEAKAGYPATWTLELTSSFAQRDAVIINGREYIYNVTPGFAGEDVFIQTAALAVLFENDLTDFNVMVNGNIITCIQKIEGVGSIEIMESEADVDVVGEAQPFLEADSANVELKIDTQLVKIDGEVKSVPDDYGKPYIDKNSGKTYVPLRMLCESLDFSVDWNANDRSITVDDKKGNAIVLKIGDTGIYDKNGSLQRIIADENGSVTTPLHIIEGRTYVQLTAFTHSVFNTSQSDIAYLSGSLFFNL